jgi:hypothetical protein
LRSTGLRAFDRWYQGQDFVAVADPSIAAIFQYETNKITEDLQMGFFSSSLEAFPHSFERQTNPLRQEY